MDNLIKYNDEVCKIRKTTPTNKKMKKQLRWAEKLEEIKYFEVYPGERGKYFKRSPYTANKTN